MPLWKVTMTPEDSLKQSLFWGDFSEVHTYPSTSKTRMAFLTSFARITLLKKITYIYNFIHMCEKEAMISGGEQVRGRDNGGIGRSEGKGKWWTIKRAWGYFISSSPWQFWNVDFVACLRNSLMLLSFEFIIQDMFWHQEALYKRAKWRCAALAAWLPAECKATVAGKGNGRRAL